MHELGVDTLLLSVGPDLPYFTGYDALPLERLTMLVLPIDGDAILVVPELEAARVPEAPELFAIRPWSETEDPVAIVVGQLSGTRFAAIGDHTWARFVLALQAAQPGMRLVPASRITGPLRAVKDVDEVGALAAAAKAVDTIAISMRDQPFDGRTERDVHRELVERMLDLGHERANFAIVASGPNAASPHHEPGGRTIETGDVVLCDFGGTIAGYCSDITRMYSVGEPDAEVRAAYDVLLAAQELGVRAATVGTPCEDIDAAARRALAEGHLGHAVVHRTGHGIGMEAHEDPYLVSGNATPLAPGHVFSIEPGVYFPGRFGLRLEDIVVATDMGPQRLNTAPRDLAVVG
jgi:Xaa-Pro aminopeptidase